MLKGFSSKKINTISQTTKTDLMNFSISQNTKVEEKRQQRADQLKETTLLTLSNGYSVDGLDLLLLEDEGFIKEDNGRQLLLLDISSLIYSGRTSIFLDEKADVVKVANGSKTARTLQELQRVYNKTVFQLGILLEELKKYEHCSPKKRNLTRALSQVQDQMLDLKEVNEILEMELRQERKENQRDRIQWRQQINKLKKQISQEKNNHTQTKDLLQQMTRLKTQLQSKCKKLENELLEIKSQVSEGEHHSASQKLSIPLDKIWHQNMSMSTNESYLKDSSSGTKSPKNGFLFRGSELDSPVKEVLPNIFLQPLNSVKSTRSYRSLQNDKVKGSKEIDYMTTII